MKYKLEYIWLDGYEPVPNLRGKTQVKEFKAFPKLEELPMWGFDGSSTRQAEGKSSDCMLKPVAVFPDPAKKNAALVMCEVMMILVRGSDSSRNISSTKTACPLVSQPVAVFLHRKVNITPALATKMWAPSPAKL
jgi:hypothetical protein